jgi:hypothetical protein
MQRNKGGHHIAAAPLVSSHAVGTNPATKPMTLRAKEQSAGDSAAQNRLAIRARPRNVGMNMWSIAADIDEAHDVARCRHSRPLDVALEGALPGSSDRLCPDSDHRRKGDKMKSSDPADTRIPGGRCRMAKEAFRPPRCGIWGNSCKIILMSPLLREAGIGDPCSAGALTTVFRKALGKTPRDHFTHSTG